MTHYCIMCNVTHPWYCVSQSTVTGTCKWIL